MGELAILFHDHFIHHFFDFDFSPFFADFAAFFLAAIFSYIKDRSYLRFLYKMSQLNVSKSF
jgi:hypothetical protein